MTGRKKDLPGTNASAGLREPCSTDRNRTPAALVGVGRPGPAEVDERVVVDLLDHWGERLGVVDRAVVADARPHNPNDVDEAHLVRHVPPAVPLENIAGIIGDDLQLPWAFLGQAGGRTGREKVGCGRVVHDRVDRVSAERRRRGHRLDLGPPVLIFRGHG